MCFPFPSRTRNQFSGNTTPGWPIININATRIAIAVDCMAPLVRFNGMFMFRHLFKCQLVLFRSTLFSKQVRSNIAGPDNDMSGLLEGIPAVWAKVHIKIVSVEGDDGPLG